MIHVFGLLAPLVLVLVLVLSAAAKLHSPQPARDAFVALRLPRWLSRSIAPTLLPWGELVLAAGLLWASGIGGIVAAVATLVLMIVYAVLIARALGFEEKVDCGCFGKLGLGEVRATTLWRNLLLVAFAAVALWAAVVDDRAPLMRWVHADASDWAWLLGLVATTALTVFIVGGTPTGKEEAQQVVPDEELLDYVRQPIPFYQAHDAAGEPVYLAELATQKAQLLLFVNAYCGACLRILGRVKGWNQQVGHVVDLRPVFGVRGPSDIAMNDATMDALKPHALYDPSNGMRRMFQIASASGAVLLGADGLLAGGPVSGETDVLGFVDDIIAELEAAQADADAQG